MTFWNLSNNYKINLIYQRTYWYRVEKIGENGLCGSWDVGGVPCHGFAMSLVMECAYCPHYVSLGPRGVDILNLLKAPCLPHTAVSNVE